MNADLWRIAIDFLIFGGCFCLGRVLRDCCAPRRRHTDQVEEWKRRPVVDLRRAIRGQQAEVGPAEVSAAFVEIAGRLNAASAGKTPSLAIAAAAVLVALAINQGAASSLIEAAKKTRRD